MNNIYNCLEKKVFNGEKVFSSIHPIRYCFEKALLNNKDKLLIVFSAFSSDEPKYNYINTLKTCDCNKLFILDDYGSKGSYYFGLQGEFTIETSVMSLISYIMSKNNNVTEEEFKEIVDMFSSFGVAEVVTENLIDAVVGVSGSSPAFVYMFIEALADGAVLEGLPRDKAIKMAAQAVLGSAKMVLETGDHPGKLKDNVCSPAGTTIEAVYALEKNNFRGTVIEAVHKAAEKNRNMSANK